MSDSQEGHDPDAHRHFLWRRSKAWWLVGIPLGGILMLFVGSAVWASFEAVLHYTNSLEFCTSCHEMRDNMLPEYKESVHYKNASGVRATCSDCHVPKVFLPKMKAKIAATMNELPKWLLGTVGTKEKFTAVRLELAKDVWAKMKATDSRECRNCHSFASMDTALQDKSARKKHTLEHQKATGETCIDCHKGVGHHLPKDYAEAE